MYTLGYIDEDLIQKEKFDRAMRPFFKVIVFDIEKGNSAKLLKEIYDTEVDLLVIDFKLAGKLFDGDVIENSLFKEKPQFPHIVFTSDLEKAKEKINDWGSIVLKGDLYGVGVDVDNFVERLLRNIKRYKDNIKEIEDEMELLIEKSGDSSLSTDEKNRIFQLYESLQSMDKTKKINTPKVLLDYERKENEAKLIKEAEDLIVSLKNVA